MDYLSVKEVAELKGCSVQYIKKIAHDGKIEAVRELNPQNNCQNTLFLFLMRSGSIIPDAGNMPARMDTQKSGLKMVTDSLS